MSTRKYNAHPQSAPGDFYVVNNECVSYGAPHAVAPELIGCAENVDRTHCIWKRQPQTDQEIEDALGVISVSEVGCHRYAGDDQRIIDRLGWEYCDSPLRTVPTEPIDGDPPPPTFGLVGSGPGVLGRAVAVLRSVLGI